MRYVLLDGLSLTFDSFFWPILWICHKKGQKKGQKKVKKRPFLGVRDGPLGARRGVKKNAYIYWIYICFFPLLDFRPKTPLFLPPQKKGVFFRPPRSAIITATARSLRISVQHIIKIYKHLYHPLIRRIRHLVALLLRDLITPNVCTLRHRRVRAPPLPSRGPPVYGIYIYISH